MSTVAFLVAVLYVCLGYAAGCFLTRRTVAQAQNGAREADEGEAFKMRADQAAEFLDRIQKLTTNVDSGVDRHALRIAEISGGLTGERELTVAAAESAAAELLKANRALQQDLASAKEEIQLQRRQLESYMAEALTDVLTGLANRRRFDQELTRRFAQWRRSGTPLSLVLVDIDHFKRFNDDHGHQAGDVVLSEVGAVLADNVRQMDLVARYGGEEFGLILPGTSLNEAQRIAERVRGAVAYHNFRYGDQVLRVTVSAGLAEASLTNDSRVLLSRADEALYAAKEAGRNRCSAHDGQNCLPVAPLPFQQRSKTDARQRIAPFVDGHFPEPGMFHEVDCEDLSSRGFSYLVREAPDYDKVLLALGGGSYSTASVQDRRNIGGESSPLYRVNCQFTVPVDRFAEAAAS